MELAKSWACDYGNMAETINVAYTLHCGISNDPLQKDTPNRFRYSFTFQYTYDISFIQVLLLRITYETYVGTPNVTQCISFLSLHIRQPFLLSYLSLPHSPSCQYLLRTFNQQPLFITAVTTA
jgi:hypothetical protein